MKQVKNPRNWLMGGVATISLFAISGCDNVNAQGSGGDNTGESWPSQELVVQVSDGVIEIPGLGMPPIERVLPGDTIYFYNLNREDGNGEVRFRVRAQESSIPLSEQTGLGTWFNDFMKHLGNLENDNLNGQRIRILVQNRLGVYVELEIRLYNYPYR